MSRYIDTDALIRYGKRGTLVYWEDIENAPSIDIVRCSECKYGEYRAEFDDYECHASGCGLVYDADFYCADGEREGE